MSHPPISVPDGLRQFADAVYETLQFSTNQVTRFQVADVSICIFPRGDVPIPRQTSGPAASVTISRGLVPPRELQGAPWGLVSVREARLPAGRTLAGPEEAGHGGAGPWQAGQPADADRDQTASDPAASDPAAGPPAGPAPQGLEGLEDYGLTEVGLTDRQGQLRIQAPARDVRIRFVFDDEPQSALDRQIIERLRAARMLREPDPSSRKPFPTNPGSPGVRATSLLSKPPAEKPLAEKPLAEKPLAEKPLAKQPAAQVSSPFDIAQIARRWHRTPIIRGVVAGSIQEGVPYCTISDEGRRWALSVPFKAADPDPFPWRVILVGLRLELAEQPVYRLVPIRKLDRKQCFESVLSISEVYPEVSPDETLVVEWRRVGSDDGEVLDQISREELARYESSNYVRVREELKEGVVALRQALEERWQSQQDRNQSSRGGLS